MKKVLKVLVVCIAVLIFGSICASAETYGNFTYKVENGEITITEYTNSEAAEVIIPGEINGYPVTAIDDFAFGWNTIISVEIPDTVKSIGDRAFSYVKEIKSFSVDENNENFMSFEGVLFNKDKTVLINYPRGKEGTVYVVPDTVTKIEHHAFAGCNLLNIEFPDSLTEIGPGAFESSGFTSFEFPGTVSVFEDDLFSWSEKLTSIVIPKSVKKIGVLPFFGIQNYDIIYYTGTKEDWEKIEFSDYYESGESVLTDRVIFNAKPFVKVFLNDKKVIFDQQPVIENGRTLVPLRAIFEVLGASVDWNNDTQTVVSEKDDVKISLTIGDSKMYVNGAEKVLDVPAKLVNSRTLVPVRAISEAFGCNVEWDEVNWAVIIKK